MADKHRFFKLWKWHLFLFELVFIWEIFITAFYWTLLYVPSRYTYDFRDFWQHLPPLLFLLIDFLFFHAYPFIFRHSLGLLFLSFVYLLVNIVVSEYRGYPVYGMINYTSHLGVLMPFFLATFLFLGHWGVCRLNDFKLRLLGQAKSLRT